MIVDRSKDFLGRYKQGRHLPYGHLEVHLGEFEESAIDELVIPLTVWFSYVFLRLHDLPASSCVS